MDDKEHYRLSAEQAVLELFITKGRQRVQSRDYPIDFKWCNVCMVLKFRGDFNRDRSKLFGLTSICRACQSTLGSVYKKANPDVNIKSSLKRANLPTDGSLGQVNYLMYDPMTKLVKVGVSNNPFMRSYAVKKEHKLPTVVVVMVFKTLGDVTAITVEDFIKDRLKKYISPRVYYTGDTATSICHEWFDIELSKVLDLVKTLGVQIFYTK